MTDALLGPARLLDPARPLLLRRAPGGLLLSVVSIAWLRGCDPHTLERLRGRHLSAREAEFARSLPLAKRRMEWLAGRLALKHGVCAYLRRHGGRAAHATTRAVRVTPVGSGPARGRPVVNAPVEVGLSHSADFAVAVCGPRRVGVDLERCRELPPPLRALLAFPLASADGPDHPEGTSHPDGRDRADGPNGADTAGDADPGPAIRAGAGTATDSGATAAACGTVAGETTATGATSAATATGATSATGAGRLARMPETLRWACKEAVLKHHGVGLRVDTREVVLTGWHPDNTFTWRSGPALCAQAPDAARPAHGWAAETAGYALALVWR